MRAPASTPRDGLATVTALWQTDGPLASDHKVFVHIRGPARLCGQHDDWPAGAVRTSQWQAGDATSDVHAVRLNGQCPPGAYPIVVGLYDAETRRRFPWTDAPFDEVTVGTIQLTE